MSVKFAPINGKVWIKPEHVYEHTVENERGERLFKATKDSKIVITEKAAEVKDKKFQVVTVLAAPDFVENTQDWLNTDSKKAPVKFKTGDKVIAIGAHISVLKYEGQFYHFIPAEFIWAVLE